MPTCFPCCSFWKGNLLLATCWHLNNNLKPVPVQLGLLCFSTNIHWPHAAAAKSLQSCPILCDPIDSSPLGSPVPGILQARTLEWVAISFSNAWKWKVKVKLLSRVRPSATPWTAAFQAPPSMGFSRQEYWSGMPLPSPIEHILCRKCLHYRGAWVWSLVGELWSHKLHGAMGEKKEESHRLIGDIDPWTKNFYDNIVSTVME